MTTLRVVPCVALLILLVLAGLCLIRGDHSYAGGGGAPTLPVARALAHISGPFVNSPLAQGHQVYLGYFGESQILVGTADGLVRTTGAGWQVILPWPAGWGGGDVSVAPDGTIYIVLGDGYNHTSLSKSTDGGQTWEPQRALPYGVYYVFASPVPDLVFAAGSWPYVEYPVYRSTDGGASWVPAPLGGGYTLTYSCSSVAFSPAFAQDGTAFAGLGVYKGSVGVWKTTDWGVTWTPVNDGLYLGPNVYGYRWVGVSPRYPQDQTAFTLDGSGLYQTTSGGVAWTLVYSAEMPYWGVLSPRYPQDQTLLMSTYTNEGLWLSQDDGRIWQMINPKKVGAFGIRAAGPLMPPPTPSPTPGSQRVYLPLVARGVPSWRVYLPLVERAGLELWIIAAEPPPPFSPTYYLYRSTDYGATWELVPVEY